MKAQVTWILVADESGGAVLAEKGSRIAQPPVVAIKPDAGGRRQDEIMADRPGRSVSSSGRNRLVRRPKDLTRSDVAELNGWRIADFPVHQPF